MSYDEQLVSVIVDNTDCKLDIKEYSDDVCYFNKIKFIFDDRLAYSIDISLETEARYYSNSPPLYVSFNTFKAGLINRMYNFTEYNLLRVNYTTNEIKLKDDVSSDDVDASTITFIPNIFNKMMDIIYHTIPKYIYDENLLLINDTNYDYDKIIFGKNIEIELNVGDSTAEESKENIEVVEEKSSSVDEEKLVSSIVDNTDCKLDVKEYSNDVCYFNKINFIIYTNDQYRIDVFPNEDDKYYIKDFQDNEFHEINVEYFITNLTNTLNNLPPYNDIHVTYTTNKITLKNGLSAEDMDDSMITINPNIFDLIKNIVPNNYNYVNIGFDYKEYDRLIGFINGFTLEKKEVLEESKENTEVVEEKSSSVDEEKLVSAIVDNTDCILDVREYSNDVCYFHKVTISFEHIIFIINVDITPNDRNEYIIISSSGHNTTDYEDFKITLSNNLKQHEEVNITYTTNAITLIGESIVSDIDITRIRLNPNIFNLIKNSIPANYTYTKHELSTNYIAEQVLSFKDGFSLIKHRVAEESKENTEVIEEKSSNEKQLVSAIVNNTNCKLDTQEYSSETCYFNKIIFY